jgi:hypothetical protein
MASGVGGRSATDKRLRTAAEQGTDGKTHRGGKSSGSEPNAASSSGLSGKQKANRGSPRGSPKKGKHKKTSQESLEMGIKNMEIVDDDTVIQTVEVLKRPGQSLGFYIREGNGLDRPDGVIISRIAPGSVVENNGLLRVGDEILTVNAVDVTHTSLDDVVILMSIPKRLVLTIRTLRNYPKNASCPSLCRVEQDQTPVVVMKNMWSDTVELMPEKCPDEFILASTEARSHYAKHAPGYIQQLEQMQRAKKSQPPSYKLTPQQGGMYTGDDSGDSGLSSENSGYSAQAVESSSQNSAYSARTGEGSSQGSHHHGNNHGQYMNQLERAVDDLDNIPVDSAQLHEVMKDPNRRSPKLSPRAEAQAMAAAMTYRSPRPMRRGQHGEEMMMAPPYGQQLDYSSDGDTRRFIPHHQRSASVTGSGYPNSYPRQYDHNSIKAFQEEIERTHSNYEQQGFLTTMGRQHKLAKARSVSPECYNSDSDVVYSHNNRAGAGPRAGERMAPSQQRDGVISRLMDGDDRCNSLPRMHDSGESAAEIKHWLQKFDTLQYELQQQQAHQPAQMQPHPHQHDGMEGNAGGTAVHPAAPDDEYWGWYATKVTTPAVLPREKIPPEVPPKPKVHPRMTRKLSADSLMDYRTYQLEQEALEVHQQDQRYQAMIMQTLGRGSTKNSHSHQSLSTLGQPSGKQRPTNDPAPSNTNRMRDLQLGRKPMQIKLENFRSYKAEVEHKNIPFLDRTLDGILSLHILCGHGLKSSRTMLRDLYLVIEVDSVNKARTMIRTGAINFDWDEAFDVDLENAHEVTYLIYSWDPNTRHRLCFSGTIMLQSYIQYGSHQKIPETRAKRGTLHGRTL